MRQYLDLLQDVLDNGVRKDDRTGTGTISVFGRQMRFNLQEGFPLVTTKKIHFKSVVHELIWLISGNTNIKYLKDNGVTIWDAWADENGDLGAVYGRQWRNWGKLVKFPESYQNRLKASGFDEVDHYRRGAVDQLQNAIDLIKNDPKSRRIIVNAWNAGELDQMALTPCHAFFQFNCRPMTVQQRLSYRLGSGSISSDSSATDEENEKSSHQQLDEQGVPKYYLDCLMLQRSVDAPIGCPYNIASYSLLTHMVAQITNTVAGEFIWMGGDTHCYINQIDGVKEQLKREPKSLPQIKLNPKIKNIDDFKYEDIELIGYDPHPHIKMPVSV